MMRFGVHLSIAKGFAQTVAEAERLGCETIQIFSRSPRRWRAAELRLSETQSFCVLLKKAKIFPLAVHSPYLPNLCTSDKKLYERSLRALREDIARAEMLCAQYLIIHPGAYSPEKTQAEGYDNLLAALNSVCNPRSRVIILLENMAGGGRRLGADFGQLALILRRVRCRQQFGICLDTCHAVGAGFDLSQKKGIDDLVRTIQLTVGIANIKLIHMNDSKTPAGSRRDRHEHIGKGYIGKQGFRKLLHHSAFKNLPAILETPKDSPSADIRNLKMIHSLAK
jgi:deoxyribonuclease IV